MRYGSGRAVLCLALVCIAAAGGCATSKEYVFLSYEPSLEGEAPARHAPIRIAIPRFTDARKEVAPNVVGYMEQKGEAQPGAVLLAEYATLAEAMTQEVARLFRLHGFEVFPDSASAQASGRLDGELKGEVVSFLVGSPKRGPLGKIEGEAEVALQLWHPTQKNPIWTAALKASAAREYQVSLTRARSATVNDIYAQLMRGVEQNIPSVADRIDKLYVTGK